MQETFDRLKLAQSLAPHLGEDWAAKELKRSDGEAYAVVLQRSDELTLYVGGAGWNKPKMACFSLDPADGHPWGSEYAEIVKDAHGSTDRPSINATASRPPKALAGAIKSRLLKPAEEHRAAVRTRAQEHREYLDLKEKRLALFARACGRPVEEIQYNGERRVHFYRQSGISLEAKDNGRLDISIQAEDLNAIVAVGKALRPYVKAS